MFFSNIQQLLDQMMTISNAFGLGVIIAAVIAVDLAVYFFRRFTGRDD